MRIWIFSLACELLPESYLGGSVAAGVCTEQAEAYVSRFSAANTARRGESVACLKRSSAPKSFSGIDEAAEAALE
jgi:hypothetical protein